MEKKNSKPGRVRDGRHREAGRGVSQAARHRAQERPAHYFLPPRASDEEVKALAEAILTLKQETTSAPSAATSPTPTPAPSAATPSAIRPRSASWSSRRTSWRWSTRASTRGFTTSSTAPFHPPRASAPTTSGSRRCSPGSRTATVKEVILATNTNLEGEQTAMYLCRLITPLGIKVTRLARGLPFGTELEYADDVTLTRALQERTKL